MAAELLRLLESRRGQGSKSVTVGNVKVEAGGQAIVGNVDAGRPRDEAKPDATPSEPHAKKQGSILDKIGRRVAGRHKRNIVPMLASPRCGARTRLGAPCRSPAVSGKKRCRMHGGALGTGAPRGNTNALKHGAYTKEALERRAAIRKLIGKARKLLREIG